MSRFRIKIKPSAAAVYGLALVLIFGIALFMRTYFPYDNVFGSDYVRFQINDPWYHMRQVENLVQHFPHRILFDPYSLYPGGQSVAVAPFFDLFLGFFIWVIGLGSPSKQVIETVGAYFPAILGALVTIPVYFMGRELFNRKVGLLAAALIAILPGQFLMRTLLGFTDHHAAETLFSALTMLFLILAVKSSKQKGLSLNSLRERDWGSMRKPLLHSLLTGIALGCYLLSWVGGGLFVFIIFVYAIIQYIIEHLRGRSTDYLCIVGVLSFLIALLIVVPFSGQFAEGDLQVKSLLIGMGAFIALSGLSFLMAARKIRRAYYPLALAGLVGIGWVAFYLIDPSLLDSILSRFGIFRPVGGVLTIAEVKGLSLSSAWDQFTTGFFLALISLVIIAYLIIKERAADKTLLLVWSLIILVATLGQNRFSYYFAVNVAILTAYLSWKILELGGFRELSKEAKREEIDKRRREERRREKAKLRKEAKRKRARAERGEPGALVTRYLSARYAYGMIVIVVVFFLAFYPNIVGAINWAREPRGPDQDWHDSLVWMRENTEDPFQDPDFYYELYERPAAGDYGVMSWWDYGYWITYIAHRIPNANPTQKGAEDAALFFTTQNESSANKVLDRLGSKYVIIDNLMALSKFHAMPIWAGESPFYESYYRAGQHVLLYYPEYYQSMCSRLYNFGGHAVVAGNSTWVISYVVRTDDQGNRYKEISDVANDGKPFTTYEEAKAFVDAPHPGYLYLIAGIDPFVSPVPLEKLEHYELLYESPTKFPLQGNETISYMKIFEYLP